MHFPRDISLQWMTYEVIAEAVWQVMLSEEERLRLTSYSLEKRRRAFLLGRAVARTVAGKALGVAPQAVPLDIADDGSLVLMGSSLSLSLAHADNYAVATVGPGPLGVDLEKIRPRNPDLPSFFLHPEEKDNYHTLPLDPVRKTILYWTIKEAVLKALRTGFRLSPKKLRVFVDLETQSARVHYEQGRPFEVCFEERHGCYCAVAYRAE